MAIHEQVGMCYRQPLLQVPLPPLVLDGCVRRPMLSSSLSSMRPVLFWRCGRVDMRSKTASSPPIAGAAATHDVKAHSPVHSPHLAGFWMQHEMITAATSCAILPEGSQRTQACSHSAPRQACHVGPAVQGRCEQLWSCTCIAGKAGDAVSAPLHLAAQQRLGQWRNARWRAQSSSRGRPCTQLPLQQKLIHQ